MPKILMFFKFYVGTLQIYNSYSNLVEIDVERFPLRIWIYITNSGGHLFKKKALTYEGNSSSSKCRIS